MLVVERYAIKTRIIKIKHEAQFLQFLQEIHILSRLLSDVGDVLT